MPAPVAHETLKTPTIRSSSTANGRRLRQEVGLVEDDRLRTLREPRAVLGELTRDDTEPLVGVPLGGVDHVQEQAGALEVGEELVTEADTLARALDQAGHVCDGQLAAVRAVDDPENRRERRERIVGHLGLRVRDAPQERRLAGIRQAGAGCVGHQLQTQVELAGGTGQPGLREAGRLTRRRGEGRVAPAALSPAGHDRTDAGLGEVDDERAVGDVVDLRPDGHPDLDVAAVGAVLARAAAVAPALRLEDRLRPEGRKIAQVGVGYEHDAAAAPTVAAVGAAPGDVLLAAEAEAAVAAASRLHADAGAIVEQRSVASPRIARCDLVSHARSRPPDYKGGRRLLRETPRT